MTVSIPQLEQFQIELQANGLAHLIFNSPGRTMNVFSNAAIHELGQVASWLAAADIKGLLIRSGKTNAFCAGADLNELGVAYEMIIAAPQRDRFNVAYDHFFPLSRAIRALETTGKPVAAAIAGLALGGGCELALGAHYRVLVDDPKIGMGLPESLVGLLPGAGGTQRLPRLIGMEAALPILLEGTRLGSNAALDAGLVDVLCAQGEEIERAESWLLGAPQASQPWDRSDWMPVPVASVSSRMDLVRKQILEETLGHYPAPIAIADCIEFGLPQCFDGAIRSEMAIFAHLIQREEPRNMIQTMFLGKMSYDSYLRKGILPDFIAPIVAAAKAVKFSSTEQSELANAGFSQFESVGAPMRQRIAAGYWIDSADGAAAAKVVARISAAIAPLGANLAPEDRRLADYAVVKETGFPAYLGGPFAFGSRPLHDRLRRPATWP
jgi:3-hydroxyacyl-CoA dehydrogenase/enoyl-CoA hydratase/3-hydroxybutyryl-CoA epimerase